MDVDDFRSAKEELSNRLKKLIDKIDLYLSKENGLTNQLPLNDHQRLALVYLRQNHDIDNQDYRRLNRVDMLTAGSDLRGLVQAGPLEQAGFGRWTKYRLKVVDGEFIGEPLGKNEKKIIAHIQRQGSITNAECRELLGTNLDGFVKSRRDVILGLLRYPEPIENI